MSKIKWKLHKMIGESGEIPGIHNFSLELDMAKKCGIKKRKNWGKEVCSFGLCLLSF